MLLIRIGNIEGNLEEEICSIIYGGKQNLAEKGQETPETCVFKE